MPNPFEKDSIKYVQTTRAKPVSHNMHKIIYFCPLKFMLSQKKNKPEFPANMHIYWVCWHVVNIELIQNSKFTTRQCPSKLQSLTKFCCEVFRDVALTNCFISIQISKFKKRIIPWEKNDKNFLRICPSTQYVLYNYKVSPNSAERF